MIRLDAPIWKKLSSAGNDVDRWLRELMEGIFVKILKW